MQKTKIFLLSAPRGVNIMYDPPASSVSRSCRKFLLMEQLTKVRLNMQNKYFVKKKKLKNALARMRFK